LFGVIEHLEDPGREIATIAQALKPGGLLVVYTGDRDAWLPRLLGKRWWWYQGMHLHYFSRHTLERLLCESGFAVVRQGTYVVYFQLFSLAKSISRYKTGRLVVPLFRLPGLRNRMVGLKLPGEMILFARRSSLDSNCSPP
jgi:SAM-dependent methyltransferase